jgi:hypothetical protein
MELPSYCFNKLFITKMNVYVSYDDQRKQNISVMAQSMSIQLVVNIGIAVLAMVGIGFLRHVCILFNSYQFTHTQCHSVETQINS